MNWFSIVQKKKYQLRSHNISRHSLLRSQGNLTLQVCNRRSWYTPGWDVIQNRTCKSNGFYKKIRVLNYSLILLLNSTSVPYLKPSMPLNSSFAPAKSKHNQNSWPHLPVLEIRQKYTIQSPLSYCSLWCLTLRTEEELQTPDKLLSNIQPKGQVSITTVRILGRHLSGKKPNITWCCRKKAWTLLRPRHT